MVRELKTLIITEERHPNEQDVMRGIMQIKNIVMLN